MTSPTDALSKIWLDLGLPADALERVRLTGTEPALPSSFRVGTAAQASIAAASLAAAEVWRLRGGPAAEVTVDMRHAAIEFRSERYFSVEGRPAPGALGQNRRHLPLRRLPPVADPHQFPPPP